MSASSIRDQAHIFLSYVKEDWARVMPVYNSLAQAGFKPWMYHKDQPLSHDFKDHIDQLIGTYRFFLTFISGSIRREADFWRELKVARERAERCPPDKTFLVVVQLEDLEPHQVPSKLRNLPWIEVFAPTHVPRLIELLDGELKKHPGQSVGQGAPANAPKDRPAETGPPNDPGPTQWLDIVVHLDNESCSLDGLVRKLASTLGTTNDEIRVTGRTVDSVRLAVNLPAGHARSLLGIQPSELSALGISQVSLGQRPFTPYRKHLYPDLDLSRFCGRIRYRYMLTNWYQNDPDHSVLVLAGPEKIGKSSLSLVWWHCDVHGHEELDGLPRASTGRQQTAVLSLRAQPDRGSFWWHFEAAKGGGFTPFLEDALKYLRQDSRPMRGSPQGEISDTEKVQALLQILRQQRVLMVLDGVENLLIKYDSDTGFRKREDGKWWRGCKSAAAGEFLKELGSTEIAGRVLLLTRHVPAEIEGAPGCLTRLLTGLSDDEVDALVASFGFQLPRDEIRWWASFGNPDFITRGLQGRSSRSAPAELGIPGGEADAVMAPLKNGNSTRTEKVLPDLAPSGAEGYQFSPAALSETELMVLQRISAVGGEIDDESLDSARGDLSEEEFAKVFESLVTRNLLLARIEERENVANNLEVQTANGIENGQRVYVVNLFDQRLADFLHNLERRVYELSLSTLGEKNRSVLERLSAFRGDIGEHEIGLVRTNMTEEEFAEALEALAARKLLRIREVEDGTKVYSLYSAARELAYSNLHNKDDLHALLMKYYLDNAPPANGALATVEALFHFSRVRKRTAAVGETLRKSLQNEMFRCQIGGFDAEIDMLEALLPRGPDYVPTSRDEKRHLAWVYTELGSAYGYTGQPTIAVDFFTSANNIYEELGDEREMAGGLGKLSAQQVRLGKLLEARMNIERVVRICRRTGDDVYEKAGEMALTLLTDVGAIDDSLDVDRVVEGVSQSTIIETTFQTLLLLKRKDYRNACSMARVGLRLARDGRMRDRIRASWLLGEALARHASQSRVPAQGDAQEGRALLEEALRECSESESFIYEADILLSLARCHRALGNPSKARESATRALVLAQSYEHRLKQADIHNFLALLSKEKGETEKMFEHARVARELALCDDPQHPYASALKEAEALLAGSKETGDVPV